MSDLHYSTPQQASEAQGGKISTAEMQQIQLQRAEFEHLHMQQNLMTLLATWRFELAKLYLAGGSAFRAEDLDVDMDAIFPPWRELMKGSIWTSSSDTSSD